MTTQLLHQGVQKIRNLILAWLKGSVTDRELAAFLHSNAGAIGEHSLGQQIGQARAAVSAAINEGTKPTSPRQRLVEGPVADLLRATSRVLGRPAMVDLAALCAAGFWEEAWLHYVEQSGKDDWLAESRRRGWNPKPISEQQAARLAVVIGRISRADVLLRVHHGGEYRFVEMKGTRKA